MSEFSIFGTLTLAKVEFYVEADSLEEAKTKFNSGKWNSYNTFGAEVTDSVLDMNTIDAHI